MASRQAQSLRERLESLEATLIQQQEHIAEQQAEIDRLRTEVATQTDLISQPSNGTSAAAQDQASHPTSRRALLKLGGVAAVGGAVSVAMGGAQVAHAADGNSVLLGKANDTNNQASTTTTLSVVPLATPANLLVVDDSGETNGYGTVSIASGAQSFGAVAQSLGGYGLVADAGGGIDVWVGGFAGNGRLLTNLQANAGAPNYTATAGEQVRDANGDLWLCLASGSPGRWVRAAYAPFGYTGGAITYLAKPIRLLDTRGGDSLAQINGGGPIAGGNPTGTPYALTVAGVTWQGVTVPGNAVGAIGNVTVVSGSGSGFLSVVPHGAGFSGTATLAYGPSQVVSNSFNTGLSGGKLDILIGGASTQVILDLIAVVA